MTATLSATLTATLSATLTATMTMTLTATMKLEARLLQAQRATLHEGTLDGEPVRIWLVDPAGAGPAALAATRRDIQVLGQLEADHPLRVLAVHEPPEGPLQVAVPRPARDRGLKAQLALRGTLPLSQVLTLARGLCAGLAALHQQGLVHGGLTPALVRFPEAGGSAEGPGEPTLLGAGWSALRVAWVRRAGASASAEVGVDRRAEPGPDSDLNAEPDLDTLRYLAPEMLQGPGGADARPERQVDLHSVGCLVYEALTGKPVFPQTDSAAVREAILRPERPDLRAELGPAEEPLARVLARCLHAEPERRYGSATALWRELAPALGGQATPLPSLHAVAAAGPTAGDPSLRAPTPTPAAPAPGPSVPRPRPPNRVLWTAGLTLAAAAIALVLLYANSRQRGGSGSGSTGDDASAAPAPAAMGTGTEAETAARSGAGASPRKSAHLHQRVRARTDTASSSHSRALGSDRRGQEHPGASAGAGPGLGPAAGAAPRTDPAHAVPPPIRIDPRTARLRGALARVGLSEREVVISSLLSRLFHRAAKALRDQDYRAFDQAMRPLELATRPARCPKIRRLKHNYIIGGIRELGPRLGKWERFRLERMLADAAELRGDCQTKNAVLRPLVLEIRDRLAYKHARGL